MRLQLNLLLTTFANLPLNVSTLRRALGEGRTTHQYIETVPKRGYRFVASVRSNFELIQDCLRVVERCATATRLQRRVRQQLGKLRLFFEGFYEPVRA